MISQARQKIEKMVQKFVDRGAILQLEIEIENIRRKIDIENRG